LRFLALGGEAAIVAGPEHWRHQIRRDASRAECRVYERA